MPSISSAVLTDGVTPLTFTPNGGSSANGVTTYTANDGAIPLADSKLAFKERSSTAVKNQQLKLTIPITAVSTDTGETLIRDVIIVDVNTRVPHVATDAERAYAVKLALDSANVAAFSKELLEGEGQW